MQKKEVIFNETSKKTSWLKQHIWEDLQNFWLSVFVKRSIVIYLWWEN